MFSSGMTRPRITYLVVAAGATIWCAAIVLAPALLTAPEPSRAVGETLYALFRPVCHQLSARSLTISGEPFAVCSRCTAVYFAFLAGTLLYPLFRTISRPVYPPRLLLAAALLPMFLDGIPGILGMHEVTLTTRLLTGTAAGLVLPFFVIPAAIEGVAEIFPSRFSFHHQKGSTDA
jgi:uncharacterized membrane protein